MLSNRSLTCQLRRPVWYSWSEARKPGNESENSHQETSRVQHSPHDGLVGYHSTILDLSYHATSYPQHPSAEEVLTLWDAFRVNVHPLVKIFFDWDKEPILHRVVSDPTGLSAGQQALCFAIYFIAAMSLSDEECKAKLKCQTKSLLLDDLQSHTETGLMAAKYASTGEVLVLQAYVLYLVR